MIDAVRFVPQSRPRLFIVAIREGRTIPDALRNHGFDPLWHPANLVGAYEKLPEGLKTAWVWWKLPAPPPRKTRFADIVEDEPRGIEWHSVAETRQLLGMMSPLNRKKVEQAKRMGRRTVGGVYKRTRSDEDGNRAQRAEIRFDDIAGCLRTPVGGSSRQTIMIAGGQDSVAAAVAARSRSAGAFSD